MGIFSSVCGALSGAFHSVCSCVGSICSGIGGALGGTFLGGAISSFIGKIGLALPGPNIAAAILLVVGVVCKIAESLGMKKKERDEPEELAFKAEKDKESKPEDFDSTEEYIKHLQQDIKISNEDKEKLDKMSPDEKSAYRATGAYLYAKACNEKLGFDTDGLKSPELVGITAEILSDLAKIKDILSPSDFVVYNKYLQANGMGMKEFSDYLHGCSVNLETFKNVKDALSNAMREITPGISDSDIGKNLYQMNEKVNETFSIGE